MSAELDEAGDYERSTRWLRGSHVTPGTGLGRRQLRGHGHKKLVGWRRQAGSEGRQGIGVHDVITSANFYDCRLWGLSLVGGEIWVSLLTRVIALTTLSHYRASV